MKYNIKNIALGVSLSLSVLVSCDYLDVVPPEQATASDTMKDVPVLRLSRACSAPVARLSAERIDFVA